MSSLKRLKAKAEHERWLRKHGVHPKQLERIPKPKWEYNLQISEDTTTYRRNSGSIPGGITVCPTTSMDRARACQGKYIIAPLCNKGAVQVVSKDDIKTMGRKV